MDRFGRSGVAAGARVLAEAGVALSRPGVPPDPRLGVVAGTAFGCRDSVTQHARLLTGASSALALAPSVFAATVHNAVAGELAILFGLGGLAETLVSGRTAGLEALALAARRVAAGDADRVLVVAAEGIDDAMRAAWERENPGGTLVESAAAVLVEGREEEEEISAEERGTVALARAELTFEAAAQEDMPRVERLGASGLWEIAEDVIAERLGAPRASSPSKQARRYTVRDVHGSCASVTLAFFS
jgi:3-oxoacyl-(acyl-carrier-protein) synthase